MNLSMFFKKKYKNLLFLFILIGGSSALFPMEPTKADDDAFTEAVRRISLGRRIRLSASETNLSALGPSTASGLSLPPSLSRRRSLLPALLQLSSIGKGSLEGSEGDEGRSLAADPDASVVLEQECRTPETPSSGSRAFSSPVFHELRIVPLKLFPRQAQSDGIPFVTPTRTDGATFRSLCMRLIYNLKNHGAPGHVLTRLANMLFEISATSPTAAVERSPERVIQFKCCGLSGSLLTTSLQDREDAGVICQVIEQLLDHREVLPLVFEELPGYCDAMLAESERRMVDVERHLKSCSARLTESLERSVSLRDEHAACSKAYSKAIDTEVACILPSIVLYKDLIDNIARLGDLIAVKDQECKEFNGKRNEQIAKHKSLDPATAEAIALSAEITRMTAVKSHLDEEFKVLNREKRDCTRKLQEFKQNMTKRVKERVDEFIATGALNYGDGAFCLAVDPATDAIIPILAAVKMPLVRINEELAVVQALQQEQKECVQEKELLQNKIAKLRANERGPFLHELLVRRVGALVRSDRDDVAAWLEKVLDSMYLSHKEMGDNGLSIVLRLFTFFRAALLGCAAGDKIRVEGKYHELIDEDAFAQCVQDTPLYKFLHFDYHDMLRLDAVVRHAVLAFRKEEAFFRILNKLVVTRSMPQVVACIAEENAALQQSPTHLSHRRDEGCAVAAASGDGYEDILGIKRGSSLDSEILRARSNNRNQLLSLQNILDAYIEALIIELDKHMSEVERVHSEASSGFPVGSLEKIAFVMTRAVDSLANGFRMLVYYADVFRLAGCEHAFLNNAQRMILAARKIQRYLRQVLSAVDSYGIPLASELLLALRAIVADTTFADCVIMQEDHLSTLTLSRAKRDGKLRVMGGHVMPPANEYYVEVDLPAVFGGAKSGENSKIAGLLSLHNKVVVCPEVATYNPDTGVKSLCLATKPSYIDVLTKCFKKTVFPACFNEHFYRYIEYLYGAIKQFQEGKINPYLRIRPCAVDEPHDNIVLRRFIVDHPHEIGCVEPHACPNSCKRDAVMRVFVSIADPIDPARLEALSTVVTCFPLGIHGVELPYDTIPTVCTGFVVGEDDDIEGGEAAEVAGDEVAVVSESVYKFKKCVASRDDIYRKLAAQQIEALVDCMKSSEQAAVIRKWDNSFMREDGCLCLQNLDIADHLFTVPVVVWEHRFEFVTGLIETIANVVERVVSRWDVKAFEVMLRNIKTAFTPFGSILLTRAIPEVFEHVAEEIRMHVIENEGQGIIFSGNATEAQKLDILDAIIPLVRAAHVLTVALQTPSAEADPVKFDWYQRNVGMLATIKENLKRLVEKLRGAIEHFAGRHKTRIMARELEQNVTFLMTFIEGLKVNS